MAESVVQAAQSNDAASLSGGAIAGIVIGSLASIVILVSGYFYYRKWRREVQRTRSQDQHQQNMEATHRSHHPPVSTTKGAGRSVEIAGIHGKSARGERMV